MLCAVQHEGGGTRDLPEAWHVDAPLGVPVLFQGWEVLVAHPAKIHARQKACSMHALFIAEICV